MEEQKKFYHQNGYLVVEDFLTSEEIDLLTQRAETLVKDYFEDSNSLKDIEIFTTKEQVRKSTNYFIDSGDKIRFFFEEQAIDSEGNFTCDKLHSINKIGHNLHLLDDVCKRITFQKKISDLMKNVAGMKDAVIPQSMFIFKQPSIGGLVDTHQDSTFMNTSPLSCHALWFALEDVYVGNACLRVVPGSHQAGIVSRFKRNAEGSGTIFEPADPIEAAPWKSLQDEFPLDRFIPLECKRGAVVVIHGSVVHRSEVNSSNKSRLVYTFHMTERGALWSPENWLQVEGGFKGFSDFPECQ